MDISIKEQTSEITIVEISGRIDASNTPMLDEEMSKVLSEGKTKVIVDLSNLAYISSAGLRVFLSAVKKLKKSNGDLRLCGLSPNIMKIFKLAGFNKIFQIFDSEKEAVDSFA